MAKCLLGEEQHHRPKEICVFRLQSLIAQLRNVSFWKNSIIARRKFAFFVSKASSPDGEMPLFGKTASSPEGNFPFFVSKASSPSGKKVVWRKRGNKPVGNHRFSVPQPLSHSGEKSDFGKRGKLPVGKTLFFSRRTVILLEGKTHAGKKREGVRPTSREGNSM